MRFLLLIGGPAAALFAFAACAGEVTVTTTATGTGGTLGTSGITGTGGIVGTSGTTGSATVSSSAVSSTSSGTGGGSPGDCQTDADCGGGTCAPLTPGGYKVCLSFPPLATMCQGGPQGMCCTSADCAQTGGGACYNVSTVQVCGGEFPDFNKCYTDACHSDADCTTLSPHAICAPAGAFDYPARACLTAFCHTDADCTAKAGGACILIGNNPCCSHPAPDGLGCVYPGDCGFAPKTACPGAACKLDTTTGESACESAGPGCPP